MSDEEQERICQECGQRKAAVDFTDFVDGKPVLSHLCDECYGKKKGLPPLSAAKVLEQIVGTIAPQLQKQLQKLGGRQCPECGISYLEFRQALQLGCPKDYEVFAEPLDDLLKRLHGASRHTGKVPVGAAQKGSRNLRLAVLGRKLEGAVNEEDFERAAKLRDEIRKVEHERAGRSEG